jgi:hypothetical protein
LAKGISGSVIASCIVESTGRARLTEARDEINDERVWFVDVDLMPLWGNKGSRGRKIAIKKGDRGEQEARATIRRDEDGRGSQISTAQDAVDLLETTDSKYRSETKEVARNHTGGSDGREAKVERQHGVVDGSMAPSISSTIRESPPLALFPFRNVGAVWLTCQKSQGYVDTCKGSQGQLNSDLVLVWRRSKRMTFAPAIRAVTAGLDTKEHLGVAYLYTHTLCIVLTCLQSGQKIPHRHQNKFHLQMTMHKFLCHTRRETKFGIFPQIRDLIASRTSQGVAFYPLK